MRFSKLSNHDAFSNLAESTPVGHVRSLSEAAVNPGGMIKFEPGLRRRIFFSGRFLTGKVAVNHIWGQRVNPLLVGAARVVATTRSFNGDGYSFTKHRRCLFKVLSFYVSCCRPLSMFLGKIGVWLEKRKSQAGKRYQSACNIPETNLLGWS